MHGLCKFWGLTLNLEQLNSEVALCILILYTSNYLLTHRGIDPSQSYHFWQIFFDNQNAGRMNVSLMVSNHCYRVKIMYIMYMWIVQSTAIIVKEHCHFIQFYCSFSGMSHTMKKCVSSMQSAIAEISRHIYAIWSESVLSVWGL